MQIILSTLNSRYTHTSLALRYLYANFNELQNITKIVEFNINDNIDTIIETLLLSKPQIITFGVYIWNALLISQIIARIKLITPNIKIILGGPEASYEPYRVDLTQADYIIKGEGEISIYELCKDLINNKIPTQKIIQAKVPDLKNLKLPYQYYNDTDIKNRYIYVEASRGCPFRCEFCLSSIDERVRYFDIDKIIYELQELYNKGARIFKFVDRTFNLNMKIANRLLDFFISLLKDDDPIFVHFEVIPDTFPKILRQKLSIFPKGSLQLEIGIQTLNPQIAKNINRKLNMPSIIENIDFLENKTNAHLHLDLIIGLPGESIESFGANLDKLYSLSKCEIQLGVLKKLSGTTINRHDKKYKAIYSPVPPYEILQNDLINFLQMQELKRFARFWDIYYNSGNFKLSMQLLFKDGNVFDIFSSFSRFIYNNTQSTYKIAYDRAMYLLYEFFESLNRFDKLEYITAMIKDVTKVNGRKLPKFLIEFDKEYKISPYWNKSKDKLNISTNLHLNKRQQRHC